MLKKILSIACLLLAAACSRRPPIRVIALEPIGAFNRQQLDTLATEVRGFFRKPVVLLPAIPMPAAYRDTTKGERYCADSLIGFLATRSSDTLILGLTDKDIYTTVRNSDGSIRKPAYKYAVWGIFGLGYCPGRACIVSDLRLQTTDAARYRYRLRTVVLHELGHNFGLPHCPNPHCIMNDANEKIATVDNAADDYCPACRNKLPA